MAPRKLERRNYGGRSPVSIRYQNLHTFKEGLILSCQSILETRRIIHLHGSAHFTILLTYYLLKQIHHGHYMHQLKPQKLELHIVSNLPFPSNTILSCFFLFFLTIGLYFLIPAVIAQTFNPTAELAIPTGMLLLKDNFLFHLFFSSRVKACNICR